MKSPLLRVPNEQESQVIASRALELAKSGLEIEEEIEGTAIIAANLGTPGQLMAGRHRDRIGPALVKTHSSVVNGVPDKHVIVQVPTSDIRAVEALEHEARQLPKSAPAIVMLGVSEVLSAMKKWPPLLVRRFQPTLNTRVSAICLFGASHRVIDSTQGIVPETKVLVNPHAALPASAWLLEQLENTGAASIGAEVGVQPKPIGTTAVRSI